MDSWPDCDFCGDEGKYDDDLEEGCCFPGECLMPGEHFRSECHTVAMMEAINEEAEI